VGSNTGMGHDVQGCVEQAYTQYRNAWAQTTVDMLVGKVHDTLTDRFSPEQRERVQHVFNTIKEAQTKRRQVRLTSSVQRWGTRHTAGVRHAREQAQRRNDAVDVWQLTVERRAWLGCMGRHGSKAYPYVRV
jgi:hypothetical protein